MSDDIANIVMLQVRKLAASSDNDLVTTSTKVFLVVDKEVFATLRPYAHLGNPAVVRDAHLNKKQIEQLRMTYSDGLVHFAMAENSAEDLLARGS